MLGTFDEKQIDELLESQFIGRIGCHADGITYIVPVNYVFDGKAIYVHSAEGMKIKMLRSNPSVCFEVDVITDIFNWRSVIVWGQFEELTDIRDQSYAMQMIINRIRPLLKEEQSHPSHGITENASDIGYEKELVVYRIIPEKKTGRFETTTKSGRA
jgi:hypothetical protein